MVEDLSIYFAEDGVPASWTPSEGGSAQSATVLFDSLAGAGQFDGFASSKLSKRIVFQSVDFVGLDDGELITVAGTTYRVREVAEIDDGYMSEAKLGIFDE